MVVVRVTCKFSNLSPESVFDDDEELLVAEAVVSRAVEEGEDDVHQVLGDLVAAGADLGCSRELLLVQRVSVVKKESVGQW